jgi:uncharacterized protein (TIGR00304 family)
MGAMRLVRFVGLLLFVCGAVLTVAAALTGGLELLFVFVFVPTLLAKTPIAIGGVLMIFFGIVALAASQFMDVGGLDDRKTEMAYKGAEKMPVKTRTAGVLLIGPIPIIWGSDDRSAMWVTIVAMTIVVGLMIILLFVV